jgi:enamine deaminase RidA (YjgF/YER057c/UK114 family)
MSGDRKNIGSGSLWEEQVGYSRAVRIGNVIEVAGTTAVDDQGATVGPGDAGAQTRFIIAKIERALKAAGASLDDVIRTRMFVTISAAGRRSVRRMEKPSKRSDQSRRWSRLRR